jgi:hypothetical protein
VDDIRVDDAAPGLRDYEASLLRLLEKVTNGTVVEINETGMPRERTTHTHARAGAHARRCSTRVRVRIAARVRITARCALTHTHAHVHT